MGLWGDVKSAAGDIGDVATSGLDDVKSAAGWVGGKVTTAAHEAVSALLVGGEEATGTYVSEDEANLRALVGGGTYEYPVASRLASALTDASQVSAVAAKSHGVIGKAGDAATRVLTQLSATAQAHSEKVNALGKSVDAANAAISDASDDLNTLDHEYHKSVDFHTAVEIGAAAFPVGGPEASLAAIGTANKILADKRAAQAKIYYDKAKDALNAAKPSTGGDGADVYGRQKDPMPSPDQIQTNQLKIGSNDWGLPSEDGVGGGSGAGAGAGVSGVGDPALVPIPGHGGAGAPGAHAPSGSSGPGEVLTPDGPMGSGTTQYSGFGTDNGGSAQFPVTSGSSSDAWGAGIGSAAALGAGTLTGGMSGGLRGGLNPGAGEALGASEKLGGVRRLGGAGDENVTAGRGLTAARSTGSTASEFQGAAENPEGAAKPVGGAAAEEETTGQGSPMNGGAGGRGGSQEKKKRGRGLGGPIAPKLEDDEPEFIRTEAHGAGSRLQK